MAHHQGRACKRIQSLFKGAQGVYVQIVRRFIKEQDIGAHLYHHRKIKPIPFATGKRAHFLLLILARKIEPATIRAAVDLFAWPGLPARFGATLPGAAFSALPRPQHDDVQPIAELLPHRLVRIERSAHLIGIRHDDRVAQHNTA